MSVAEMLADLRALADAIAADSRKLEILLAEGERDEDGRADYADWEVTD